MHIVIPMSGMGKRFVDAGYSVPKPLIKIDGKPIIQHVVELFPGESKFTFICNDEHIKTTDMKDVLLGLVNNANIVTIPKHKLGPVYAVQQIYSLISDDEEVIVNYCDFGTYWNYKEFLEHTRSRDADGAVPAYKNFHPHMLGSTNYAFMRDENQWMLEIQEKKPFTDDRMREYASNGTYYFKSGQILKRYFDETIASGEDLNGEYYVSVVYNRLVKDNLKVSIYEIQHMLQWGTPQDVEEYLGWSKYFESQQSFLSRARNRSVVDNLVVPMAGEGSRFRKEGFVKPKPFICVNGKPMVFNAICSLPSSTKTYLGVREEHIHAPELERLADEGLGDANFVPILGLTDGQATTCEHIVSHIPENESLVIGACDNGMVWDEKAFEKMVAEGVDVIVWAFKDHPHANSNPEQYGWIETKFSDVTNISVKRPISSTPQEDFGVVGAFYFKNKAIFSKAYEAMVDADCRVNGEFYVDTLINFVDKDKLSVKVLPVEHFICWGTPDDYKTFNYWQSYFHKSFSHAYDLNNDMSVQEDKKREMIDEYISFGQEYS
ncbi:NTP transferase domain-containing protein [Vibrio coralliilyticus]|uniref:NTP transferase domain-containing protein n=1 Tax=Vibrio coralliilyticus TaxID=190893 RepID=UPI00148B726E|nr:NTP transferase domain-containing protein [Vibrio coralliilyticus]NOI30703.1 NTP transferase domain-containing protein [Vibrio coralliilyticus]NOI49749.1 NTP transferase domain-containing protein [Vibrio coralliilyticus]WFB48019.1 NTP transferase domain-containing protein [Vibrio coralliilyticus]